MSKVDHEKKILLQLTILAALKVTPAKAQNIIFVTSVRARAVDISSSHLILSSTASLCKARTHARSRARTHAHQRDGNCFCSYCAARGLNICRSHRQYCKLLQEFFFHGLPSTLLQLFYFINKAQLIINNICVLFSDK
jgi:hypothetical protein